MSGNGKIAYIIRKKTSNYAICIEALRALEIPAGFTTEFVTITAGRSIAADRQRGMRACQADYKLYIDDNAIILDEKFIYKLIAAFQNNRHIGLLGTVGTDVVPTNGIALSSSCLKGELYNEHGQKIAGTRMSEPLFEVKAVIGSVMATQYDLDWPLAFSGDFFYDTAMSLEYQRHGYKCAIVSMSCPMVLKGSTHYIIPQKEQDRFLDAYSSDLYPLVSVIIATYQRPAYLEEAINSVIKQTYRNLDILVSDRSYDMQSETMVKEKFSYDKRLHYVHHANFDRKQFYDYNAAYNHPQAEYVNWLMDDDLFAAEKIARMMDVYLSDPGVSLVSSYRKCINAAGEIIPDMPYTAPLADHNFKVPGCMVGKAILLNQMNIIGELSTCLIKKANLNNGKLGCFNSNLDNVLSDVTAWINMCSRGDVVYLADPLSYVRIHDGQDQNTPRTVIISTIFWALLLDYDINFTKFLGNDFERNLAMKKWLRMAATSAIRAYENEEVEYYKEFKKVFSSVAQAFAGEKKLDLRSYYK